MDKVWQLRWEDHPRRLAVMSKLSKSELSRRRLSSKTQTRSKPKTRKTAPKPKASKDGAKHKPAAVASEARNGSKRKAEPKEDDSNDGQNAEEKQDTKHDDNAPSSPNEFMTAADEAFVAHGDVESIPESDCQDEQ